MITWDWFLNLGVLYLKSTVLLLVYLTIDLESNEKGRIVEVYSIWTQ